jgi:hypothetical protein
MLQRNRLQPPRPIAAPPRAPASRQAAANPFVSAEDFDVTGLLAGVDPCESRYWWMPELYGPDGDVEAVEIQATRRTSSRPTAAA